MAVTERIVFVSGNRNKLEEIQGILGNDYHVENVQFDLPELQGSLEEICREKCRLAACKANCPVLVEDTSLVFNAWGELPGPYVKWFLKWVGVENFDRLLAGFEDKSAKAICTMAYCTGPDSLPIIFQGITQGRIVPCRGPKTFGWDSVFEYAGQTYAEMNREAKNQISHRRKALDNLQTWLREQRNTQIIN